MNARVLFALVTTLGLAGSQAAGGAPQTPADRLVLRAYQLTYNLDFEEALKTFEEAAAANPKDAEAYRGIATHTWLHILYHRGVVTVDDYMGRVQNKDIKMDQVPPAEAARFKSAVGKALALAEAALARNPRNAAAHYDVGAAVGLMATYAATVEGSVMSGFRAAQRAYNEQEAALELDPRRKDAGMIVGVYRYIVANLPFYVRPFAYLVGFGGNKELGLKMIEEAAAYPGESQTDAKFALLLLYNRERRFDQAMKVCRDLQARFPRNRILWLEAGATALRAKRPAEAEAQLNEGIARLANDTRPRSLGEEQVWYYKRGAARVLLGNLTGARADLTAAASAKGRQWVAGRVRIELGKLADLAGDRGRARTEYLAAKSLAEASNDPEGVDEATALLRTPYRR